MAAGEQDRGNSGRSVRGIDSVAYVASIRTMSRVIVLVLLMLLVNGCRSSCEVEPRAVACETYLLARCARTAGCCDEADLACESWVYDEAGCLMAWREYGVDCMGATGFACLSEEDACLVQVADAECGSLLGITSPPNLSDCVGVLP